jgi:hypothetical protein
MHLIYLVGDSYIVCCLFFNSIGPCVQAHGYSWSHEINDSAGRCSVNGIGKS